MPIMDGFAVLSHLRADPRTEHLDVIVQTGREDVAAIDQAFHLGATSFVTKPLNWRLLAYQIRYVLRTSRDARSSREQPLSSSAPLP
jgi:PleD family two-component response regulator